MFLMGVAELRNSINKCKLGKLKQCFDDLKNVHVNKKTSKETKDGCYLMCTEVYRICLGNNNKARCNRFFSQCYDSCELKKFQTYVTRSKCKTRCNIENVMCNRQSKSISEKYMCANKFSKCKRHSQCRSR